jgi:hypothetical protein
MKFLHKVTSQYVLAKPEASEKIYWGKIYLDYDVNILKKHLDDIMTGKATEQWYFSAASKLEKALAGGKVIEFYLDSPTAFGGILYAKIEDKVIQISKKKLRINDAKFLLDRIHR